MENNIKKETVMIELGITNQNIFQSVESEKMRKYDLLANKLCQLINASLVRLFHM